MNDTAPPSARATVPPPVTWEALIARLSRRLALFLDYDGTLVDIAPRPELAAMPAPARALLARLAALWPVAVVSGRDLADLHALVGLDELVYVGSHGFDIAGPDIERGPKLVGDDHAVALHDAWSALAARLADVVGVIVERKRFAITVHYRLVAEGRVAEVAGAVHEVAAREPRLKVTSGKRLVELRPNLDWDKGSAVLWLLEQRKFAAPGTVPLFVGDDETDEDAFRALHRRGTTIVVADPPRPSHADYHLPDTNEVTALLTRLAEWGEGGGHVN
jgi:trehalose 6-phosphate phosphatase